MTGLQRSRWAPALSFTNSTSSAAAAGNRSATQSSSVPADELARHQRLLRRLRWKLPYLADSHRRATLPDEHTSATDRHEAELMFKLDFFEYYVLLERALLHLLAVFGITVSRHAAVRETQAPDQPFYQSRAPIPEHNPAPRFSGLTKKKKPTYDLCLY